MPSSPTCIASVSNVIGQIFGSVNMKWLLRSEELRNSYESTSKTKKEVEESNDGKS
jgi:hypothetical protein